MYPILMRTEFGFIYTFTAVYALAVVTTIWFLFAQTISTPAQRQPMINGLLAGSAGALLLGRAFFIISNQDYFLENVTEIWRLDLGGHTYNGVMWGFLIALGVWVRWKSSLSWSAFLPLLTAVIAGWHFAGWFACWAEGCAFGARAMLGWASADLPDQFGVFNIRYRTQAAGMVASAVIWIYTAWRMRQGAKQFQPTLFWQTLALLTLMQFGIGFWRGEDGEIIAGLRVDQWENTVTLVVSAVAILVTNYSHRTQQAPT